MRIYAQTAVVEENDQFQINLSAPIPINNLEICFQSIYSTSLGFKIKGVFQNKITKTKPNEYFYPIRRNGKTYWALYEYNPTFETFFYALLLLTIIFIFLYSFRMNKFNKDLRDFKKLVELMSEPKYNEKNLSKVIRLVGVHTRCDDMEAFLTQTYTNAETERKNHFLSVQKTLKTTGELENKKHALDITEAKVNQSRKHLEVFLHEMITPISASGKKIELLMSEHVSQKTRPMFKSIHHNLELVFSLVKEAQSKLEIPNDENPNTVITPRNTDTLMEIEYALETVLETCSGKSCSDSLKFDCHTDHYLGGNIPHLVLNKDKLKCIFINLFKNSIKYSDNKHIKVTIKTSPSNISAQLIETKFTVEDVGSGFNREYLKNNTFQKERNDSESSYGMGIDIVRENLTALNSELHMSNVEDMDDNIIGARSSFTITSEYRRPTKIGYQDCQEWMVYTNDEYINQRVKSIASSCNNTVSYIEDEDLEVNQHNKVLIIDFNFEEFSIEDIRWAAQQYENIKVLLLCSPSVSVKVEESDILLPHPIEDDDGHETMIDNIYMIKTPLLKESFIDALYTQTSNRKVMTSLTNTRVLIIEDMPTEMNMLTRQLGQCAETSVTAKLHEAKKQLNKKNKFDVIICDYNLIDGDISEIIDILSNYNAKKILHCGYQNTSSKVQKVKHAFDHIVMKSTSCNTLTAAIEDCLGISMTTVEQEHAIGLNMENITLFNEFVQKLYLSIRDDNHRDYKNILHNFITFTYRLNIEGVSSEVLQDYDNRVESTTSLSKHELDEILKPYFKSINVFLTSNQEFESNQLSSLILNKDGNNILKPNI